MNLYELTPFASHLWQSSLFTLACALLNWTLRRHRASLRHSIWLVASAKFLVPFSLFVQLGHLWQWRSSTSTIAPPVFEVAEQLSQPFTMSFDPGFGFRPHTSHYTSMLAVVWLCGFLVLLARWLRHGWQMHQIERNARPLPIETPIPVLAGDSSYEPGVFGIFRPVLLIPEGIAARLSAAQLNAIIAHELCHVRRRDNLAAAFHMLVSALFWFHPLVWWIGSRLVAERENACDEEVLDQGQSPLVYAESILNVCKFYLESPIPCASGVTGADLKKRIETIMTRRHFSQLSLARKLFVVGAATAALCTPVLIGIATAPQVQAQDAVSPTFDVVSIKPSDPNGRGTMFRVVPGGGLNIVGAPVRELIMFGYGVRQYQISGGPGWVGTERFDVTAKGSADPNAPSDPRQLNEEQRQALQLLLRKRIQALLAERFQLQMTEETKELPVYHLVEAKGGAKLKVSDSASSAENRSIRMQRGMLTVASISLTETTTALSNIVGRPVIDKTGKAGLFDLKLEWTPEGGPGIPGGPGGPGGAEPPPPADAAGPTIFTALQEQWGLKLESAKGPVVTYRIDSVQKPSAN
ncbi:M56 family metallopeptidase [Bryobacter aggregatus]|uniref:M56 family metallopeptidase n=1 Tax=Bryobacter aggregatus TaxID=360054 RepID=UPI0004E1EF00|nr:M56 family metallopeptidase [Bryobacter aggregatus]